MKSRYMTIKASEVTDEDGNNYPDLFTFPIKHFKFSDPLKKVTITQRYINRFYLVCYDAYGTTDYDDIILWLNSISSTHELELGSTIYIPSKADLDKFLTDYKEDND